MPRVDHRYDCIEQELVFQILVEKKCLRHRTRISHSGGFNQHIVKPVAPLEQLPQYANQVAAHRAANAAVVGFEYFFLDADHQLMIDPHLTKFILDNGNAFAVLLGQNSVEQRSLAGAQKSSEHRNRYSFFLNHKL